MYTLKCKHKIRIFTANQESHARFAPRTVDGRAIGRRPMMATDKRVIRPLRNW